MKSIKRVMHSINRGKSIARTSNAICNDQAKLRQWFYKALTFIGSVKNSVEIIEMVAIAYR